MNADILFFLNEWATNTTPDKFYREKMGIFPKTFSVNNKSLANEIWAKSGNPLTYDTGWSTFTNGDLHTVANRFLRPLNRANCGSDN